MRTPFAYTRNGQGYDVTLRGDSRVLGSLINVGREWRGDGSGATVWASTREEAASALLSAALIVAEQEAHAEQESITWTASVVADVEAQLARAERVTRAGQVYRAWAQEGPATIAGVADHSEPIGPEAYTRTSRSAEDEPTLTRGALLVDMCLGNFGAFGACVGTRGHDGRCEDAFGYRFYGRKRRAAVADHAAPIGPERERAGDVVPRAIDAELREVAALCTVTEPALWSLRQFDGFTGQAGDPWPFRAEDATAPIGSAGWWSWATTVLAVAHNTRKITMITRNGLLADAYTVREARAVREGRPSLV